VLWCGLGKSPWLARVRGSPVRYVITQSIRTSSNINLEEIIEQLVDESRRLEYTSSRNKPNVFHKRVATPSESPTPNQRTTSAQLLRNVSTTTMPKDLY
jgi:hypothetical protein